MTQTVTQSLLVERYQPRTLGTDGQLTPVMTFDEFIDSLRAEAKMPVHAPRYAKPRQELVKWQNAEADRLIAERIVREKELAKIRRPARRRKEAPKPVELDAAGNVAVALSQGMSLRDAIEQANKKRSI